MSNVESPNHYTAGYIEVIYAIHDVLGREGFKAFCMGNYIKYNARANHKGLRTEDLAKADQYLEWATNGLPDPVDGRVPRQPDLYKQFAEAMAGPGTIQTEKTIHETVERVMQFSPELGAGYGGDAPATPPNAQTVAGAIGPIIMRQCGKGVFDNVRLRVTKNKCETHDEHVWFTAYIYDLKANTEISRAIIMTNEPDEDMCEAVGMVLSEDIENYFS